MGMCCRKFKEAKLKEDPTWTLEKEMAKKRGQPLPQQVMDMRKQVIIE